MGRRIEELNTTALTHSPSSASLCSAPSPWEGEGLRLIGGRDCLKLLDLRSTTSCSPTLIRFVALSTFPVTGQALNYIILANIIKFSCYSVLQNRIN